MRKFLISVIFMIICFTAFPLTIYIPNKNFLVVGMMNFWTKYTPDNGEYRIDTRGVIHFRYKGKDMASNMFIIEEE